MLYDSVTKRVRNSYAGFGWILPESPGYCAEFTTMCNNICRNTARIDPKLVKDTPNAARIGHELTEVCATIREIFLTIVINQNAQSMGRHRKSLR